MSWDPKWSVEAWLEKLGLASYTEQFIDNGYNLQELCANLKDEDLDAIGIHKELHRTRLFAESSAMRDEAMARFKKSKGGGSAGSTDHSGSMGSHGSIPAYTEPWGEEGGLKHHYSDVWEQTPDAGGGHGITPALANLMQNGGQGQAVTVDAGDKHKGLTFPLAPPAKAPRKKTQASPGSQTSFTLPAAPALPPPRTTQKTVAGGLNRLQLKLKVLEELQKDRIILSEPPYCKADGSVEEDKISELSQTYSERFHIEPAIITETIRDICKGSETKKSHDDTDSSSSHSRPVQRTPILSTSELYEEPVDVMRDDLTTFKEPTDHVSLPSSPTKKGKTKKGSPLFLQKPKPSSSESSPEQKRRGSPRSSPFSSPRNSPFSSPVTSPRERKIFGFFSKKKTKKAARSNSTRETDTKSSGKAGRVFLLPGHSKVDTTEDQATASPAAKNRSARSSLTHNPPPSPSDTSNQNSPAIKGRTVSMSSTSTTGSESSPLPLAPKKFGIMRFSQRWGSPQRQHKAKTDRGRKDGLQKALTTSDMELNRVGLKEGKESQQETLRGSQSQEHLFDTRISVDSPPVTPKTKKASKQRGGLFSRFRRKRGGKERGKNMGEEEEGDDTDRVEVGLADQEDRSFLTTSISMPNIAALQSCNEDTATRPSPLTQYQQDMNKSATAPSKPSRHLNVQSPASVPVLSPDPSPLPQRKVMQTGRPHSGDVLIQITHREGSEGERGGTEGGISSWRPLSPSNQPTQGFDADVFSGTSAHENVSDFREPVQNPQRSSLNSTNSIASRTGDVAGSVESHESSVFGSCTSDSSVTLVKTGSGGGSLKKPAPPPKPKSLERGKTRGPHSTSLPKDGQRMRKSGEEITTAAAGGGGGGDVKARDAPPPKPPRPMRGSVKRDETVGARDESKGREGVGGNAVPPPKPARRNRSVKLAGTELQQTQQRKTQTMQPLSTSRDSCSPDRTSTDGAPSVSGTSATPRKPATKPRTSSSGSRTQAKDDTQSCPPSLKENIAAKLTKEDISLSISPYSTVWGEWNVPALLVSRYAQELDHPPEMVALLIDDLRGQDLKKNLRDYVPVRRVDCLKNTAISTDTVPDFLTSIGLPMYASVLSNKRFTTVSSLCTLNKAKLNELKFVPSHSEMLLKQLRT